ncbi:MAG: hypothetical protein WC356_01755 [Candidatus Micrarchaeia archaeon]|jgi:hypothetical protein
MDAGPAKSRKRFTAGVRPFEVEYEFPPDEMAIWEDFLENDISDGALSFVWPHPRKWGTTITVRLVPKSEDKLVDYEHLGAGVFRVAMTMEQLP